MPICPNCQHEFKQVRKKREQKETYNDIRFNPETRLFENITESDKNYWEKQFPAIDIEQELSKMEAWLYANPKNRKKKYVRFITNWLSKAQDKAPRYVAHHIDPPPITNGYSVKVNIPSWKSGVGA